MRCASRPVDPILETATNLTSAGIAFGGRLEYAAAARCIQSFRRDREFDAFPLGLVLRSTGTSVGTIRRHDDPTNGTISGGDVGRFGGELPCGLPTAD